MQEAFAPGSAGAGARTPDHARSGRATPSDRLLLALLAAGAVALVAFALQTPDRGRLPSSAGWGLFVCVLATSVTLGLVARRRGSWRGTFIIAIGTAGSAGLLGSALGTRGSIGLAANEALVTGSLAILLVASVVAVAVDFADHVASARSQVLSDMALVTAVTGGALYMAIPWAGLTVASGHDPILLGGVLLGATLLFGARSVHTLWCPSRVHLGLLASAVLLSSGVVTIAYRWDLGPAGVWPPVGEVLCGLAVLVMAVTLLFEPRLYAGVPNPSQALPWARVGIMATSLLTACAILPVAFIQGGPLGRFGTAVLMELIVAAVVLRLILNQVETARTARRLEQVVETRDSAIDSLQAAAGAVAASEERLRLLFDSAADAIVELDQDGRVVRTNGAFCTMVRMHSRQVLGRHWEEMASDLGEGGASLAMLLTTGEATLDMAGGTTYLEARSSPLPTTPPGTLLLIRDVTASRVAEQTIRSLFKFLQDRDEDRTRLLKRTNAAIEAERNRIARDLHDGPIQGISGASLSVEAVKLMLDSGAIERASEVLGWIRKELGEQSNDLRRLMSDLRPPVLEERGLFPAVRELCGRLQRESGIRVDVVTVPGGEIPTDLQTLAYRVVQEALSNVHKHAQATRVTVRLEIATGTLEVEVTDDGRGFDPSQARDFLYRGNVGLASMRERTELLGGTFVVRSRLGGGTTVIAALPFDILSTTPRLGGAETG